MASILLRIESMSSSNIERLTASARQVAVAELSRARMGNAALIVGNVRAMEASVALAGDLSRESILDVHRALMEHDPNFREPPGELRQQLVRVGGSTVGPVGAQYVAPHHDDVPDAIDDLVAFMARQDLDPVVQLAIAHAQFETIHPFTDGNGRTGRALVQALLRRLEVSRHMTLPVSAGLLRETDAYFAALTAYRQGDAGPIVEAFAEAMVYAAGVGGELVARLGQILHELEGRMDGVRSHAHARRLVPLLVGAPVVDVARAAALLESTEQAAARALATLAEREVVSEMTGRLRGRAWQQRDILAALDEFAASIRRA